MLKIGSLVDVVDVDDADGDILPSSRAGVLIYVFVH